MHTSHRFAWRGLLSLIAILMLLLGSAGAAMAQATPDASPEADLAGPALGDAVVLYDTGGDEIMQVAVTQLVDPDDEVESADRGFHWVGIEVVVSNSSDRDVDFNAYAITVVDAEGFVYNSGFASRTSEDYEARPDFASSTVPAGESASGWLFYQVINDAAPAWILFNDSFGSQQFAVLANLTGEAVEDGAAVPFYDASAEEIGTASVDEIVTNFEETDSSIAPARGMTTVGVMVTITNSGTADLQPNSFAFYLIDDLGFLYYPNFYFRSEESLAQYPDLPTDPVPTGGEASGLVLYEIPSDATVSFITYQPDYTQFYILAQPGPGSTVSGDTLTPVAAPTSEDDDDGGFDEETPEATEDDDGFGDTGGEETGECVGVTDWSDATGENIAFLNEMFADVESIAEVSPDDLRDAADEISDAIDAQGNLDTPDVAQPSQDAVVAVLTLYADLFEEAADRLDEGDDPEDIQDDLDNNPEFETVINDLFSSTGELAEACPDSDLDGLFG